MPGPRPLFMSCGKCFKSLQALLSKQAVPWGVRCLSTNAIWMNSHLQQLIGYEGPDISVNEGVLLIHHDDVTKFADALSTACKTGRTVPVTIRCRTRPHEISTVIVRLTHHANPACADGCGFIIYPVILVAAERQRSPL
jgi:hypothetical protein